ncbi:MAG: DUF5788 family protein [Methanosarcina sp.]
MLQDDQKPGRSDNQYIGYEERNKLLWRLRSDFAWAGKKIPDSVEIEGNEYNLKALIQELQEKKSLAPDKVQEIRLLIPKLRETAKLNEEFLETEELTRVEAEALYEEATGLLRAAMELEDRLQGKNDQKSADEFKKMLNAQKLMDEKGFQKLLKDLK